MNAFKGNINDSKKYKMLACVEDNWADLKNINKNVTRKLTQVVIHCHKVISLFKSQNIKDISICRYLVLLARNQMIDRLDRIVRFYANKIDGLDCKALLAIITQHLKNYIVAIFRELEIDGEKVL